MEAIKPIVGILAVGRNTFDVPYAEQVLSEAWQALQNLDIEIIGEKRLLFDTDEARKSLSALKDRSFDILLLLQVTFTDASMTLEIAQEISHPLVMWSFPEPRTGGRLRLNSFCGINLAAHALSRNGLTYHYIHGSPDNEKTLDRLTAIARASAVKQSLNQVRIGVIGNHPDGFDACIFSHEELRHLFGIRVEEHDLIAFLDETKRLDDSVALPHYRERKDILVNIEEMDKDVTLKTLKAYEAMRQLIDANTYAGLAVRCWPEFFTRYGAAACGAVAILNEKYIPGGCEADVHGVVTSLILQRISSEPAFNTDLVDIDPQTDTCVFWHCGQAPVQMADPDTDIRATIHSNRKLPLLNEFALKPGRFTMARLSKGHGKTRLVIGGGEMQQAPLAFSGTAGVARLDSPVAVVLDNLMQAGLEHHTSIVYGEHRPVLRIFAGLADIEIVELTR